MDAVILTMAKWGEESKASICYMPMRTQLWMSGLALRRASVFRLIIPKHAPPPETASHRRRLRDAQRTRRRGCGELPQ